jgi:hypothetical protein
MAHAATSSDRDPAGTVAIMQPYFFPYIGYFQLVGAVDTFVIYDDVNFAPGHWMTRNRILLHGAEQRITLSVRGASQNARIGELELADAPRQRSKLLRTLQHAYARAPRYAEVMPLLESALHCTETNLARYLAHTLRVICDHLGLAPRFRYASELAVAGSLRAQARIIAIATRLGARRYINLIGGRHLYDATSFAAAGLELRFLQPQLLPYPQGRADFVPSLSIIDVLMHLPPAHIRPLLAAYELL